MGYIRTKNNLKWQSTICQVSLETQLLKGLALFKKLSKCNLLHAACFHCQSNLLPHFLMHLKADTCIIWHTEVILSGVERQRVGSKDSLMESEKPSSSHTGMDSTKSILTVFHHFTIYSNFKLPYQLLTGIKTSY